MNITKLKLSEIPQFSFKDKAYINEIEGLGPFYNYSVQLSSFEQIIKDKQKAEIDRSLIVETLMHQYQNIDTTSAVKSNIDLLSQENTFTIITAHQPSLMTGPSYYYYKIFSVLNLVAQLRQTHSDYHFVPVFITGGEDHDFEEVNHFKLYGKTFTWASKQTGSVGKFVLDPAFDEMFASFLDVIGDGEQVATLKDEIQKAKTQSKSYADFAIRLTDLLFRNQGLVVVDMSAPAFKKAFVPIIKKEIFDQPSAPLVQATQKELEQINFKAQAFARPINFFYTGSGDRLRIEQEGDQFRVVGSYICFTRDELEQHIEDHPEHFSPNVVMRPIYQEFILPNLAYIGGGGEIAYWLERKTQFESFGINFPMLIRRNSGMVIDKGSKKKMDKLSLSIIDLLQPTDAVISQFLETVSGEALEFDDELEQLKAVFHQISAKAKSVDPSLESKMLAEGTKISKQVDQLTSRVKRAAKQKEETSVNQIIKIKEKLFPNMGLQERKVNFLEVILKNGIDVIPDLIPAFDPLEKTMVVIEE